MKANYGEWLKHEGYDEGTIGAQLYRVSRVEEYHGSLDEHFSQDGMASLIEILTYSTDDQRNNRPNPTKIPFEGHTQNNLSAYKNAAIRYRRFLLGDSRLDRAGASVGRPSRAVTHSKLKITLPIEQVPKSITRVKAKIEPRQGAKTLIDFGLDGRAALEAIIAASQYRTLAQAVASLTLFTHPQTVRQTDGKAIFPTIRNQKRVGEIAMHDGRQVLLDDNKSPTDAFLWANGLSRRGPDTQFNHLYAESLDADAYTALPNLCMTPAFIAKLTDTNGEIRHLLQCRSYQLYGWVPKGKEPPIKPDVYEVLEWAAPLPAIGDVRAAFLSAMATKPKDRTVMAAQKIGWLFSE